MEEKAGDEAESQIVQFETNVTGSEEMELNISLILEKIENFTQRVAIQSSTLCEAWNHSRYKSQLFDMLNGGLHVGIWAPRIRENNV